MKQLQLRLVLLVSMLLLCSAFLLSWSSLRHFRQDLPPQMASTVVAISHAANGVFDKAFEYGVPMAHMTGVGPFLDTVRKDNPDLAFILVTDLRGKILFQSGYAGLADAPDLAGVLAAPVTGVATTSSTAAGDGYFVTSVPMVSGHQRIGTMHLGQPAALVRQRMQQVTYDVVTVLVVAILIALELLRFVLTFVVATPAQMTRTFLAQVKSGDFSVYLPFDQLGGIGQLSGRLNAILATLNLRYQRLRIQATAAGADMAALVAIRLSTFRFHAAGERRTLHAAALDHIRWPFFLLVFADSLSLSFFPVYVGHFYSPAMGLSRNIVVGLPISIFMFTWALSMPWAGMLSDRIGHRKSFVIGAVLTTAGLVLTACAQTLYDLLLWRCITALGYGLVFITAQGYVTNNTPPTARTRGMAVFLSSFFAGSLAGSAVGGILADRIGHSTTILFSGLVSAAAGLFVLRFLHSSPITAMKKKLTRHDFKLLLANKKFVGITFLAAVPAKIALTGFLYYAVPLYLKLLGNDQATTGRVMMAYGLAIILISPLVAKLADRFGNLRWFVSLGGFAASGSMFIVYCFDNTAGLLAAVTVLGIAHSIGVSPQLALINDLCKEVVAEVGSGTATGIFRLIERLGNVLGPIIAGLLISQFGFNGAFLGIGIVCLVCVSCFSMMFFWTRRGGATAPLSR